MGDAVEAPGGTFFVPARPVRTIPPVRNSRSSATIGRVSRHRRGAARVPPGPLLDQFRASPPADPTPAEAAIRAAAADWLRPEFLDAAADAPLADRLAGFAHAVLPLAFHGGVIARRVRVIRYALNHLARGHDPLPARLGRCATPGGMYHVPGLGPSLWAALAQALDPDRTPRWCPAVERGLTRLGLFHPADPSAPSRFALCHSVYFQLLSANPDLTAPRLDDFLARVGRTTGRELPAAPTPAADLTWGTDRPRLAGALRGVRTRTPLRERLRGATAADTAALAEFHAAARDGDGAAAWRAFRALAPDPRWEHALARLDDAFSPALPVADRGLVWAETAAYLREHVRVHPLELADLVTAAAEPDEPAAPAAFGGFCADTFRFLGELGDGRSKPWMDDRRDRYQFVLRDPLVELCEALAARYIRPVLGGEYGWELEADARNGRALTSICKNDFGRGGPYQPVQWVTFYRKDRGTRRADAQFFVRVARRRRRLRLPPRPLGPRRRPPVPARNVQTDADALYAALARGGGVRDVPVPRRRRPRHRRAGPHRRRPPDVGGAEDARRRPLAPGRRGATPGRRAGRRDPADVRPPRAGVRVRRRGRPAGPSCPAAPATRPAPPAYDPAAFAEQTLLPEPWLDPRAEPAAAEEAAHPSRACRAPGRRTSPRCLARLLARDNADAVRLVQFPPRVQLRGVSSRACGVRSAEVKRPDGGDVPGRGRRAGRRSRPGRRRGRRSRTCW
jgi:5-methylcytosine-specific restriction protein B